MNYRYDKLIRRVYYLFLCFILWNDMVLAVEPDKIINVGESTQPSATTSDQDCHYITGLHPRLESDLAIIVSWEAWWRTSYYNPPRVDAGQFPDGKQGNSVIWKAPNQIGDVIVQATADNSLSSKSIDSPVSAISWIRIVRVDLDINGISDDAEEQPGGEVVINEDDDNGNLIMDKDENGTVLNEDDLVPIYLVVQGHQDKGTVTLSTNSTKIKIWENSLKVNRITLPKTWNLETDIIPSTLYVEGVILSGTLQDVQLELQYQYVGSNVKDKVCFTVVEALPFNNYADIDADSDRTGSVEGNSTEDDMEITSPAIIIVNCDNDDKFNQNIEVDCYNMVVDGPDDVSDLAPLVIRGMALPSGWKAILSIASSDVDKIGIFDARAVGSNAVLGFGNTTSYEIPNISSTLTYGVEARRFRSSANETIMITLSVKKVDGSIYDTDSVKLIVAPFIMLPNTAPASRVYVGNVNWDFVSAIEGVINTPIERVSTYYYLGDKWVQDQVEIGYIRWPSPGGIATMQFVWNLPRSGGLVYWPGYELLGPNYGVKWQNYGVGEGGDIEVTPPGTYNGVNYPFGIAVVGDKRIDWNTENIIKSQNSQVLTSGEIVKCDTQWLKVGHIDEVVSFIPNGKVLINDTIVGYVLVGSLDQTTTGCASGGGANTLVDNDPSDFWPNKWQDGFIEIKAGTGKDQVRKIVSNNSTTITVSSNWTTPPDATSEYEIVARSAYRAMFFEGNEHCGLASGGTTTSLDTVNLAGNWSDGYIIIVDGTCSGQGPKKIAGNTLTTITLASNESWIGEPDNTSRYVIVEKSYYQDWYHPYTPAVSIVRELCRDVEWRKCQMDRQANINAVRAVLKEKLGLLDSDFIRIPALYNPDYPDSDSVSLMPNMVNSLIVEGKILIPKPFGPRDSSGDIFENEVTSVITGLVEEFIDYEWKDYHYNLGEVHCGTNAKRDAPSDNWWE